MWNQCELEINNTVVIGTYSLLLSPITVISSAEASLKSAMIARCGFSLWEGGGAARR